VALGAGLLTLVTAPAAGAQDSGTTVGDLTGNWPWTVWLLIPLALLLGVVTALALGAAAPPETSSRRRAVSQALDQREVAHRTD
jgi:hypothetical protein